MSKIKKIIAAILVFAVCLSVMAAPVSAAQAGSYPNIYTDSPVLTEIGRGGSVTYQFMPAYTGVYRFYSEGENDSFAVLRDSSFNEMVSNDDISDENLNFAVEGTLYVGETYYLECSLSSRKDSGFYYVTVTKLSGTEYIQILGDRQIEGTIGDTVTLEAQMYPDDSFEGYGWYSNNTGVADVDQNGVVTFISSGYAQIVAVTDITGMTDSVTVYVDDCYSIEAGLSVSNIISSNKPSCRYKFIPNESGKYPVSFQSLNGEMININILNKDTDECIYSNSSSDSAENIEFKAGCSYIIDIYNYEAQSDIEFVLSLSTLIYLNGISIIDYDGNDIDNYSEYIGKTYSFNIKFDPEDIREDISWKSSDDSIASVDEYGNVTLNSPGYAIITATAKSGVEDTVLVNVKDYVNVVCNAGYNEFLCKNGDRFIFRFTPNEDGYYNIKASNHGGYFMTIRLLESEYGDTLYGDFEKTYHFIAGSEHLIEIKASGEEFQTSNFTFIIEKMNTATEIQLFKSDNEYEQISYISGYEGYSEYLTYKLIPEDSYKEEVVWETSDKAVAYVVGKKLHYVGAGVATITARVASGACATLTVEVYEAQEIALPSTVTVSPTERYQTIVYKYTHTSRWYDAVGFKIDSEYSINCRIKEVGSDDYILDDTNSKFTAQPKFKIGKTYYILLKCTDWEYTDYTIKAIPLRKAEAIYIEGDEVINGYAGTSIGLGYNFGEGDFISESVSWTSDNQEVAQVNEYGTVTLVGQGTAVITVTSENNLTDSVTVNVSEMPTVNVEEEISVTINTENERKSYKFTIKEDGKYALYVNSEMYTYISLGLFGGSLDFSNSGYGYRIEFTAGAGAEYFLETYIDDRETLTGSYTFKIVKLSAPVEMYFAWGDTVLKDTFKAYAGSEGWLNIVFAPEGSYSVDYTIIGDNDEVAEINEDGFVRFKKQGTVNVTATSENGFTVTLTVIVEDIPYINLGEHYTSVYTRPNEYVYYKFTPSETGYYRFDIFTGLSGHTDIYDSAYNHIGGVGYHNGESNYVIYKLNAGETYNLHMYLNDGNTGANTLLVTKAKVADAIIFSPNSPTEVYINEEYWYSVEPMLRDDEGNYYPTEEDVFIGEVRYSVSDKTVAQIYDDNRIRFIKEGTVTIYAVAECGARTEITVTVKGGQEISLGETLSGWLEEWNSEVKYKFTPEKDGVYGVFFNNLDYSHLNGEIAVYDEEYGGYRTLAGDGGVNFIIQCKMTAGETYYIIARYGYGRFNATVKEITKPATSVYFEVQRPNYCIVGDRYSYDYNIRFSPEDSIKESYTLSVSDNSVAKVIGNEIEYIGEGVVTVTVTTESGLTDSFEVTVINPIELEIGKTETHTTVHPHQEFRFLFTVEEEGWYGIYMNSDCDMYYDLGSIDNENRYIIENSWFEKIFVYEGYFYPGTTYYVDIYEYYCNEISTTDITVRKLGAATGYNIEEDEVTGHIGDQIKLNAGFVPEYSKSEEVYWSSSNDKIASVHNGIITIYGKGTVTITATTESGFTDSVTVIALGYENIKVNSSFGVELTDNGLKYYEFTPDESAVYILSSNDEIGASFVYLFDEDFNQIAHAPSRDSGFILICSLEKGVTYYFGLGSYNSSTYNYVTFEKLNAKDLVLGEDAKLSLEEGKSQFFKFTPDESKAFKLYSEGQYNTYAILYDSDFNPLIENDNDKGSSNFGISYSFIAGETYYLEVRGFDYRAVECTVKVKEVAAVQEINIIKLPNKTEYYEGLSQNALNLSGLELEIVFSDGTSQIWKYGYENNVGDYTLEAEINYNEALGDIESVYIICGDKSAEIPITIIENPVESIEVIHNGIKLYEGYGCWYHDYYGYSIYDVDYSNLLLKVNYTDGSFAITTVHGELDGYSFDFTESQEIGLEWTAGGENPIMIYFCGKSLTVCANMVKPEVKEIKVISSPDYVYSWGDEFFGYINENGEYVIYDLSLAGLSLEITYNNGTTEILNVTEDNEYKIRDLLGHNAIKVTSGGEYNIAVSYLGCKGEITIKVIKPDVQEIEVIKDPDVTVGAYEAYYDFDGMQFKVTDSNGNTRIVTIDGNCMYYGYMDYYVAEFDDGNLYLYNHYDKDDNLIIKIRYGDAECDYQGMKMLEEMVVMDFEVTKFSLDPSEIEISVIYADGSTVSYKGIDIVESVDSDGFFGAIKSPYGRIDVSVGKQQNSYGEVIYYYVNLGNLGTQIDGTVIIESIEINTLPDKTDYESDEELDVRGLTIKVNYSDGSSTVIDEGYRVSVDEGLAGSGKVVNINYAGHTASFKTTVSGEKVYGDANLDGIVDIDDLVAFKKVLLGAESENDNCDVNGDGNVNILDFIRMKKHLSENAPLGPDNTVTVTTEVAMVAENKNTVA